MSVKTSLLNLSTFQRLQLGELDRAISRGRLQARVMAQPPSSSPGFGLNRQSPSVIESRLAWWTGESVKSLATRQKTGDLVKPDWEKINYDLHYLAERVAVSVLQAMDRHLGAQALHAREEWPVLTGLSRALLSLRFDIEPTVIRGILASAAPYTIYIREAKVYDIVGGKMVARSKKRAGLPGWKMAYLRKGADGKWAFDAAEYEAGKLVHAARIESGKTVTGSRRKPAKGHPFQDLIVRPGKATADAIGRDAVAGVTRG